MKILKKSFVVSTLLFVAYVSEIGAFETSYLKIKNKHYINIPEPSDVCLSANKVFLYIVSDQGYLYETDLQGKVARKSNLEGDDFEAVYANEKFIYVVDESDRKIYLVNANTLMLSKTIEMPYKAEINEGVEGITYIPQTKHFLCVTEKNPVLLKEYDENFSLISETKLNIASDVSALQYFNHELYALSDEDHCIIKLDNNYKALKKWSIKIPNPEGFCFDKMVT